MSIYKKYTSSIIANVSSSAHTNEEFKWYVGSSTLSNVYFGMEDDDSNFTGKLSNSSYTLSSDTSGCSAIVSDIDSTKTAGIIYLNIPANTSTTNRTIVFKYGTVSLFTVVQLGKSTITSIHVIFSIYKITTTSCTISYTIDNWDSKLLQGDPVNISLFDTNNNTSQLLKVYSNYGSYVCSCNCISNHVYNLESYCEPSSRKDTNSNIQYYFSTNTTSKVTCL